MQTKQSKAKNFSYKENELLLKYALQNYKILENTQSNKVSWKDKNKCWLQLMKNTDILIVTITNLIEQILNHLLRRFGLLVIIFTFIKSQNRVIQKNIKYKNCF